MVSSRVLLAPPIINKIERNNFLELLLINIKNIFKENGEPQGFI